MFLVLQQTKTTWQLLIRLHPLTTTWRLFMRLHPVMNEQQLTICLHPVMNEWQLIYFRSLKNSPRVDILVGSSSVPIMVEGLLLR